MEVFGEAVVGTAKLVHAGDAQLGRAMPFNLGAQQGHEVAELPCTCGSLAALVSVETPSASAAQSTKFSVVVTLA